MRFGDLPHQRAQDQTVDNVDCDRGKQRSGHPEPGSKPSQAHARVKDKPDERQGDLSKQKTRHQTPVRGGNDQNVDKTEEPTKEIMPKDRYRILSRPVRFLLDRNTPPDPSVKRRQYPASDERGNPPRHDSPAGA